MVLVWRTADEKRIKAAAPWTSADAFAQRGSHVTSRTDTTKTTTGIGTTTATTDTTPTALHVEVTAAGS